MNWDKLKEGKCPEIDCDSLLRRIGGYICCENCDFKIREAKYMDSIKGKESNAYKAKVKKYRNLKKLAIKKKNHQKDIAKRNNDERIRNLNVMLKKGRINQEYYDSKMKLYANH